MRLSKVIAVSVMSFLLTACAASLLIGNAQSRLLWSFLQPLVGFNPYELNLLENPLIKPRMQSLLGTHYDTTIKLLSTANELQQEGAIFYIMSRYAPDEVKEITDKAAFIWNADTNQMAVMLIENGLPTVFSETLNDTLNPILPTWPNEVKAALTNAEAYQKNLKKRLTDETILRVNNTLNVDELNPIVSTAIKGKSVQKAIEKQLDQEANKFLDASTETLDKSTGGFISETKKSAKALEKNVQTILDAPENLAEKTQQTAKNSVKKSIDHTLDQSPQRLRLNEFEEAMAREEAEYKMLQEQLNNP